jgi:drug/metabolite transporter (DMT)-like permease
MIYLILSILSSTAIFIIFKFLDHYKVSTFPVIVYNYLFAAIPGYLLLQQKPELKDVFQANWIYLAVFIGILFILMFYVIALSSASAGISITTVASKMSVVIPISYSIIADPVDKLTSLKLIGIIVAIVAVFLTILPEKKLKLPKKVIYLPILLFFGMGVVDSLVKHAQLKYITDNEVAFFTSILFFIAFLTGIISILFTKGGISRLFNKKVFIWGLILGFVNFGSIYFLIRALNFKSAIGFSIDSSIVFGINNTGIVILSVLTGLIIFREKPGKINWIGILLALLAIFIFTYIK